MDAQGRHLAQAATDSNMERWEVDLGRSRLTFKLRHIVMHEIEGRFTRWGGTLVIDRASPSRFRADIWVDLASIQTGNPERDAHLCSSEFLDVARFPRAQFRSTDVQLEDQRITIDGWLDLHGVVRDVELRASVGPVTTEPDGRERTRYAARGTLDRQAFGLHWNQDLDIGGVVVSDEVAIAGDLELVRTAGVAS
jgi:polyisoprenoid-binding protein YceI